MVFVSLVNFTAYCQPDCNNLPAFTQANTFNNVTITNALYLANQNVRISGTVNFNANVTFEGCTILMDPNAVINVNNSAFRLLPLLLQNNNLVGSTIFACGTMWQAINVNNGGSIIFRGSIIRSGKRGVVFNQGFNNSTTEITGCTFYENSTAISATNIPNFTFSAFSGNTFTGMFNPNGSNLLPPHNNGTPSSPNTTREPVFGMRLNNVTGMIGTSGAVNTFENCTTAIRADGSTLTVNNCSFLRNFATDWEGFTTGIGIWVINSNLTIENIFSNNASCTFDQNRRAVRFDFSGNLTLKNAVFSNQRVVDVEVVGSAQANNIRIMNNTMTLAAPSEHSIFVDRAAQGGGVHTRIQSNTINLPFRSLGGPILNNNLRFIEVFSRPGTTDQALISDNQITSGYANGPRPSLARTTDAIWIQGSADGYQVSGNIINFVNANGGTPPNADIFGVAIGMTLNNGIQNIIGPNNTVTTTRFAAQPNGRESWLRCGVHVDASQNVWVCKNDVDDPRHGYHFNANCNNGEFGRNKIRDGHYGLIFTTNAVYPNQNYRLNTWITGSTFIDLSATSGGGNIGGAWRYDPNFSEYMAPNPVENGFQFPAANGGASNTPICDGVLPPTNGYNEPPTGDQAVKFLNGAYSFSNAAASWDFERNLLEQMIRFPNSFAGEASAQNYYAGKVNSVVWNFAKATRMLHDAAVISASQQASIDQIYASDTQFASDLTNIEIAEGADASTIEPTLQSNKTTILAQMAQNKQQLTTIQSSISAARVSGYDSAISFINNLSTSNVLESNQKTVLLLQARYLKGEAWTVSDSASLRNIAYACPETGGEAVFTARGMLPAPERYNFNEVEAYCESGQRSGKEIAQDRLTETLLFPNPAKDKVTIGFSSRFSGQVEVLTLDGKVLIKTTCEDCIQKEIDTKGVPNGLYLVRLTERAGIGQTIKLSIAR